MLIVYFERFLCQTIELFFNFRMYTKYFEVFFTDYPTSKYVLIVPYQTSHTVFFNFFFSVMACAWALNILGPPWLPLLSTNVCFHEIVFT